MTNLKSSLSFFAFSSCHVFIYTHLIHSILLTFYYSSTPLSMHFILSQPFLTASITLSKGVEWTGVKLLELWRCVSGVSPIKVISNSWILPFDGRIIPFGSHSLTLDAPAPCKQDQREMLMCIQAVWTRPLILHFILDWCKSWTHSAGRSLHAFQIWISEREIRVFVLINGPLCYFSRCAKTKKWCSFCEAADKCFIRHRLQYSKIICGLKNNNIYHNHSFCH